MNIKLTSIFILLLSILWSGCSSNNDNLIANKLKAVNDLNQKELILLYGAMHNEAEKELNNSKRHFIDSLMNNVDEVKSKLDSSLSIIYKFNRVESLDILSKSWTSELKDYTRHKFSLDSTYSQYPLPIGKELLRQDLLIYTNECFEDFAILIDVDD